MEILSEGFTGKAASGMFVLYVMSLICRLKNELNQGTTTNVMFLFGTVSSPPLRRCVHRALQVHITKKERFIA